MSSAPFMQLYVADYLGDTQHLTTEQHGAYLLLMMAMWRNQGRLQNDPAKLARIARVNLRRWHFLSGEVMEFFDVDGDFITQKRLVREYQKALSISEKRSSSGRLGGMAKSLKNNEADVANAKQMQKHSQISEPYIKKEELNSSSKKTGSRLTAAWSPSEKEIAFAADLGMSPAAILREADQFRDYWISKTGKDATKLDWEATWRGWVRRAHSRTTAPPKQARKTAYQEHQEACARELDKIINRDMEHDDGSSNIIDLGSADYRREGTARSRWG